ncbi:MAG: hypothetical protein QMC46_02455, partial [Burkholderiaceae bacterium]
VLLHVVDAANPAYIEQIIEVQRVLGDIGAGDIPQILLFNKLDLVEGGRGPRRMRDQMDVNGQVFERLFVSAHTGEGLDGLRALLVERLALFQMQQGRPSEQHNSTPDEDAVYEHDPGDPRQLPTP